MGWERRQRGGYYYTRSKKMGARVLREYVGTGILAELASRDDELERQQKVEERRRLRDMQKEWLQLQTIDKWIDKLTKAVVAANLKAAGYHQHHRGEWRKRRGR
jgi:crotonobetainyl-CoA:carnitine CoA-transferase CaiB-like acyl-CoA transferase